MSLSILKIVTLHKILNLKQIYKYILKFIFIIISLSPCSIKAIEICEVDSVIPYLQNIEREDTIQTQEFSKSYRNLKNKTSKYKWTKKLFSTIITEPTPPDKINENKSLIREYQPYDGKIIRNINITVLDPFGTDVRNPQLENANDISLNYFHTLTRKNVIRNNLQFEKGENINAAIIAESEAILRNLGYINDARILINTISESNDSVDISVIVRDKWTIGIDIGRLTSSNVNLEFFDKNLLGMGNKAGVITNYSNKYDKKWGMGGYYEYDNIAHTFIDLEALYEDEIISHELSLSAKRTLHPKLNYLGEISYYKKLKRSKMALSWDSISPDFYEDFSVSLGRAFTLPSKNSIRRIVLGIRYKIKNRKYEFMPYNEYIQNTLLPYKNVSNKMWLMQLSLYQNSYLRDYLIHNFGTTEDLAQGYNISMQFGYSKFNDISIKDGLYSSLKASFGSSQFTKGNIYFETAISSFFSNKKPYESLLKIKTNYFTPLLRLSNIRVRQFVNMEYIKLLTPDRFLGDRIYMGKTTSLVMKNYEKRVQGVEQFMLKSETDIFSPYELLNFRFLFYTFLDVGWNTDGRNLFGNDNFNWGTGIGIRIRNDLLVFKTLDIKIGYYPKMDQNGYKNFYKASLSTPKVSPNFIPTQPEEIVLE